MGQVTCEKWTKRWPVETVPRPCARGTRRVWKRWAVSAGSRCSTWATPPCASAKRRASPSPSRPRRGRPTTSVSTALTRKGPRLGSGGWAPPSRPWATGRPSNSAPTSPSGWTRPRPRRSPACDWAHDLEAADDVTQLPACGSVLRARGGSPARRPGRRRRWEHRHELDNVLSRRLDFRHPPVTSGQEACASAAPGNRPWPSRAAAQPARFQFNEGGTRFRVHLQPPSVPGFAEPAIVPISAAPGTIGPGPEDNAVGIRVLDARDKPTYRDEETWKARWRPPCPEAYFKHGHPVAPDPDGHFLHLRLGTRAFSAGMAFAVIRTVRDIWEHHFQRGLPWVFRDTYEYLEVIPRVESANAWSGEGFVEFGFIDEDPETPFADHFDSVAHETGHLILKSVIGNPVEDKKTLTYRAHEEAGADLVALVALLHFDEHAVKPVLMRTGGRLFGRNPLSRIGEHRSRRQFRMLFNEDDWSSIEGPWNDYDTHGVSVIISGAAYDLLVALYHERLRHRGELPPSRARRRLSREQLAADEAEFPRRFRGAENDFLEPPKAARDYSARLLALAWDRLSVEEFATGPRAFHHIIDNLTAADGELSGGVHAGSIRDLFRLRGLPPRVHP